MQAYRAAGRRALAAQIPHHITPSRALLNLQNTTKPRITSAATCQARNLTTRSRLSTRYDYVRSLFQRSTRQAKRHNSSTPPKPDVTSNLGSPEPALSLSQRMRKLSREYGWSAFGVYMALSALDFPFCFLAVRMLGTDRIGQWEHAIVSAFWRVVPYPLEDSTKTEATNVPGTKKGPLPRLDESGAKPEDWSWGVEEAEKEAKKDNASMCKRSI
jgi:hypothetical protein